MHVEYLLVIDSKGSFCSDISSFKNLLVTSPDISLEEDLIKYKNIVVGFQIQLKKMEEVKNAFHVKFIYDSTNNMEEFEKFMRLINGIFYRISKNINTLRDDISLYYSELAYPKIHQVENLMRKLITKFMITNVGLNWTEKHVPNEVKTERGNAKADSNTNYLYTLDFIQLSNILFKKYSPFTTDELFKKISNIKDDDDIELEDLKKFIPTSNWDRYFSEIVNVEGERLKKIWEDIYEIRNRVAHNNILEKRDYDEIDRYVLEVKKTLEQAVDNLDKISVPDKEKEIISKNLVLQENNNYENEMVDKFQFLRLHSLLEETLTKFILKRQPEFTTQFDEKEIIIMSLFEKINFIKSTKLDTIIDPEALKEIRFINKYRNKIVHTPSDNLNMSALASVIVSSRDLLDYLDLLIVEKD